MKGQTWWRINDDGEPVESTENEGGYPDLYDAICEAERDTAARIRLLNGQVAALFSRQATLAAGRKRLERAVLGEAPQ